MGLFDWLFGSGGGGSKSIPALGRIDVKVTAQEGEGRLVAWSHTVRTPGHGQGQKIKATRGQGYRIKFSLDDETERHIRFDASGPFFCKDGIGDPCPDSISSEQVMVESCDDNELVVIDWNYNENEEELRYQLNFVTDVNGEINPYDPVIINGGGGVRPGGGGII